MDRRCNETKEGRIFPCVPLHLEVLLWVISTMLLVSLCWNLFCCVLQCRSGKLMCKPRTRRRGGPRQMEENPIYGNISYLQTSLALLTGVDPSSSMGYQHRINSDSQPKTQDCYANLTLKAPRPPSDRISTQMQYSDTVHLEEPPESEKEDESNADVLSNVSDLYASVQNQRTKTVMTAEGGEGYVNHL